MCETLDLSIDADQYRRIQAAEAVVVNHYTGPHGRFARLVHIGTIAECEEVANTPRLLIVPTGVECEGAVVVPVSELIEPEKTLQP